MADVLVVLAVVVLFPVAFVGMWSGIVSLLAHVGGWTALARAYTPPPGEVQGEVLRWQSGRLGFVNYSGCLNLTANPEGVLLSVSLPFRPGHRAFFVPWEDVRAQSGRRLFFRVVRLRFSRVPGARLELHLGLAERLRSVSGQRLAWQESR